jgi:predicted PurR-regulated permease PerM
MQPAPPPGPEPEHKPDLVESLQESDLKRWSPRRAGLPPLFDWWPSYLALVALTLLALLAASRMLLDTLVPFAHVLLVFSLAAAVTFAVAPLVERLEARMPRPLAVALVFVGLIAAIAGFAIIVVRPLTVEGQALADRITEYAEAAQGKRPFVIGDQPLPSGVQDQIRALVEKYGPDLAARSGGVVLAFLAILVDVAIVLVVTFYLLLDARRFRVVILRALEPQNRPGARRVFFEISRVFGAYLRSQLIVAVSLAVLVSVALSLIGVPYALLLGAFAGIVELVPMLGPFLGAIPALLIASTQSVQTVVFTAVAFVLIQQFESNVLVPRLTGNAVGLHPLAAMLALLAGFEAAGIVGALFAVPIVGVIWVFISTTVLAWRGRRFNLQQRRRRNVPWRPRRKRYATGAPDRRSAG